MKKLLIILLLGFSGLMDAQAYKGKGDIKFQVGGNIQKWGSGISVSTDFGIGENMSYGFVASYLLSVDDFDKPAEFEDRADVKVRFNANLGDVFGLDKQMDIYPGLSLGTRNFGGHVGFRYFFTEGFGLYTEAGVPLASYDSDIKKSEVLNNQFVFQIGACFNL